MSAYYRARKQVVLRLAIDAGLEPYPTPIAQATRLSVRTVNRMLAGHPVSAETMAALYAAFGPAAGEAFEIVDDPAHLGRGQATALRSAAS